MKVRGVIVAAGYGTRFLPITRSLPKEMLPIIDRPCLDLVVQEFVEAGIEDILIITSRRKKALDDWFDWDMELRNRLSEDDPRYAKLRPAPARVTFVRQHDMGGTGHALRHASDFARDSPTVVAFPDDLFYGVNATAELLETHRATGASVLGALDLGDADVSPYGVIDAVDEGGTLRVRNVVEKPPRGTAPSSLISVGRYLYTPDFFPELEDSWTRHTTGEFYPMEAMKVLAGRGRLVARALCGTRHDTGAPLGYLKAVFDAALERPDLAEPLAAWLRERLD